MKYTAVMVDETVRQVGWLANHGNKVFIIVGIEDSR
jgi:hypothetical protein